MHASVILSYAAALLGKTWVSTNPILASGSEWLVNHHRLESLMIRGGGFGIAQSTLSSSFRAWQRWSGSVPTCETWRTRGQHMRVTTSEARWMSPWISRGHKKQMYFPLTLTHMPVRSYYLTGLDTSVSVLLNLLVASFSVGSISY